MQAARKPSFAVEVFPSIPPMECVELAREAEQLGFDTVWFGDSHLIWREVYTLMGAAALVTRRVTLGTAVTNVVTRHPTVTASGMATLAELSGGRVICGVGLGDSALETCGLKPVKRSLLEETTHRLRRMWAGEQVEFGDGVRARLAWYSPRPIPVYWACSGPKMLEDAGAVADGAIILVGTDPRQIQAAYDRMKAGAQRAGRSLENFRVVLWVPCCIADDGAEARNAVKAHVARAIRHPLPLPLEPEEQRVVEELERAYNYYEHMSEASLHARLVPDSIVAKFAIAGTRDECLAQTRAVASTGVDQIGLIPMGRDRRQVVRRFAEEVMAEL